LKPRNTPVKAKPELNKSSEIEKPRRFSKQISKNDLNISNIDKSGIKSKKELDSSNIGIRTNKSTTNLKKDRLVTPTRSRQMTDDKMIKKDNSFINSKMIIKRDPSKSIFKTRANEEFFNQNQGSDGVNLVLKPKDRDDSCEQEDDHSSNRRVKEDKYYTDIVITPIDRFKNEKESHRSDVIVQETERINETKQKYNRPIQEDVKPNERSSVSTKYQYNEIKDEYKEQTNKQLFDKHNEAPKKIEVQIGNKEIVKSEQHIKEPSVSELLKQMKLMSDRQLLLIDSIDKIQENTKEQFDFMNTRIKKLENTVSYLVNFIQNVKKENSDEINNPTSGRNVFETIMLELKVIH
jgi:hypothetical protein